jgi:hypothetical protein
MYSFEQMRYQLTNEGQTSCSINSRTDTRCLIIEQRQVTHYTRHPLPTIALAKLRPSRVQNVRKVTTRAVQRDIPERSPAVVSLPLAMINNITHPSSVPLPKLRLPDTP